MKKWFLKGKQDRGTRIVYMEQLQSPSPSGSVVNPAGELRECSFCHAPAEHVGSIVASEGAAICETCLLKAQQALDANDEEMDAWKIGELYRFHFRDARRERQFLASVSFFATFATVRIIVRSIQEGRGPFHNVSAGGKHIHHLVWGILTLLGVGYVWLIQIGTGTVPPRNWMRQTAILYGAGSALTLDEFALWLNLSDVYFTNEGRESVDAVILFGSLLSVGFWGRPFLHSLARLFIHKAKEAGGQA